VRRDDNLKVTSLSSRRKVDLAKRTKGGDVWCTAMQGCDRIAVTNSKADPENDPIEVE
jgi:hypothetical protein